MASKKDSVRVTGPFWRYYGGKFRAASKYPAPIHDTIIEPFAGAAGYACRYPDRNVILIEKNPVVAATWRYLIGVSAEEILAIPDIPAGGSVDDLNVCQEARWLAGWWCNDATVQPSKQPSAWARTKAETGGVAGWTTPTKARIIKNLPKIRHWQIIEGTHLDAPDIKATWFVDPPYQTPAGRFYPNNEVDYPALGEWCLSRKGQVIVCEQAAADWLPWNRTLDIQATPGAKIGRDGVSKEVWYYQETDDDNSEVDESPGGDR